MPSITLHQIEEICGRCGKKAIRKFLEEKETDGGYTRYNTFEPRPEGWCCVYKAQRGAAESEILCPECVDLFNRKFDEFMTYTLTMGFAEDVEGTK